MKEALTRFAGRVILNHVPMVAARILAEQEWAEHLSSSSEENSRYGHQFRCDDPQTRASHWIVLRDGEITMLDHEWISPDGTPEKYELARQLFTARIEKILLDATKEKREDLADTTHIDDIIANL